MIINNRCLRIITMGLLVVMVQPVMAITDADKKMLNQLDQLDQLEHMDFMDANRDANYCISVRNFNCAEGKIAEAEKSINNQLDKNLLRITQQMLAAEKQAVADEEEAERQWQLAEERRVEQERQARIDEERAQERREQAAAEHRQNMAAAAMLGAIIGGHGSEASVQYGQAAYNDVMQNGQLTESSQSVFNQLSQDRIDRHNAEMAEINERKKREREARAAEAVNQERLRQADRESKRQLAQAESSRQAKKDAEILLAQQESERKRLEDDRLAKAARDKLERQRAVEAEAARKKAEKEQEALAQRQNEANYLKAMQSGIHLKARHCPDGEGKHYIVGLRPKVSPEVVGCIDVYYIESCPGSAGDATGVITNFLGAATDCFMGDAATVSPTPSCKPEQATVSVTRVAPGCNRKS